MSKTTNWSKPAVKKEVLSLVKFGQNENSIRSIMRGKVPTDVYDDDMLDLLISDTLEDHPNFDLMQNIVTSKLAVNKQSDDNLVYFFNTSTRKEDFMKTSKLNQMFTKFDFASKVHFCDFEYNPEVFNKFFKVDGVQKYNLFNPPFWMADYFFEGTEIPKSEMPEVYDRYLKHFTNNHAESYEYVLDWMANSLRRRNQCILTAIGNQGTGKGVLGEIMRRLWCPDSNFKNHMADNFDGKKGSDFKKEFNGFLENKKVFYIDEITINNIDQEDRVKVLVNDFIDIEKKGEDSKTIQNYASIYCSSNSMNAIRLRADDRRFSVLEMSSDNLNTIFTDKEIKMKIFSAENIKALGQYLWHRVVDPKKMNKVFVTERTKAVRESSLREWEEYFIEELCQTYKGKRVRVTDVSDEIENNFGSKFRPSRSALKKLEELYPHKFKVWKPGKTEFSDGRRVYVVDFSEEV